MKFRNIYFLEIFIISCFYSDGLGISIAGDSIGSEWIRQITNSPLDKISSDPLPHHWFCFSFHQNRFIFNQTWAF
uniref:Putative secreted protein n=1 Tax=Anopheles marajoara TaxID=58244 RepID=A0A2M4CD00_9DIPT